MKTTQKFLILPVCLIASVSLGQKDEAPLPNFTILEKGKRGWKPTKLTLISLGQKVDAAMRKLAQVGHQSLVLYEGPKGNGRAVNTVKIKNQSTFSIQYPNFDVDPPFASEVRADGKRFAFQGEQGWSRPAPLPAKSPKAPIPAAIVRSWPAAFNRVMFANIVLRSNVWTALVTGLAQKAEGYSAVIEERTMVSDGKKVLSYRILAVRPPAVAKKYGLSSMEMVIDGARFLPVTIRCNFTKVGAKKPAKIQWQGGWAFKVPPFKPADFRLPK